MPRAIYPTLFKKYPDFGSLSDEERERLLEKERQDYESELQTAMGSGGLTLPEQLPIEQGDPLAGLTPLADEPEEELRRYASRPFTEQEELPLTAGLGLQEEDMPIDPDTGLPEGLGAFTQEDVGAPVSDEQALQWEEERRIYDAPYKISSELRKSRDYKQELIDKQFGGVDPNVRDVKKHASSEMSEAKKQFEEILGRTPNTPEERLASFNFQQKAKEEAYKQKQDDIAALNDAVSKYTTEQVIPRVKFIQGEAAMLQEKHAGQEKAETEARAKVEAERAKAIEERHKREFPTEKELAAARDRLFAKRIQIEKFKERPSDDVLKAYNKIAKSLGEPEIPLDAIKEAGWSWKKIKNWLKEFWGGKEESEETIPVWNPEIGDFE